MKFDESIRTTTTPQYIEAGDTFFPRGIIFSIYAEAQKWKKVQIVAENGGTYWEVATERELHSKKVIELSILSN